MELSLDNLTPNVELTCFTPDMTALEQPVKAQDIVNPEPLHNVSEVKAPEVSLAQQKHSENKLRYLKTSGIQGVAGSYGVTGYQGVTGSYGVTGYQGVTGTWGYVGATGTGEGLTCSNGLNLGEEEDFIYPKIKRTKDYIEKETYSDGFTVRTRVGKPRSGLSTWG